MQAECHSHFGSSFLKKPMFDMRLGVYAICHVGRRRISSCQKTRRQSACRILGVSLEATDKEVRIAFHRKALQCHPDMIQDQDDKKVAEAEFKELESAYAHLLGRPGRTISTPTAEAGAPSKSRAVKTRWQPGPSLLFSSDRSNLMLSSSV